MENKAKAELELEFIKNIIKDSREKVEDTGLSGVIWEIIYYKRSKLNSAGE